MTLSFWLRDFVFMRFVRSVSKHKLIKDRLTSACFGYLIDMTLMRMARSNNRFPALRRIPWGPLSDNGRVPEEVELLQTLQKRDLVQGCILDDHDKSNYAWIQSI